MQMISSGMGIKNAGKLARLAQDVAVIGGINSSEAFMRLIHGIQVGSPEMLRDLGINANFEQSYQKYGTKIGKSAADLTEMEKVQARMEELIRIAPRFAGVYEAAMGDVGKQMTSLKRYFDEAKNAVGDQFRSELELTVNALKNFAKWVEDHPELARLLTFAAAGGAATLFAGATRIPGAAPAVGLGALAAGAAWGAGRLVGKGFEFVLPRASQEEVDRYREEQKKGGMSASIRRMFAPRLEKEATAMDAYEKREADKHQEIVAIQETAKKKKEEADRKAATDIAFPSINRSDWFQRQISAERQKLEAAYKTRLTDPDATKQYREANQNILRLEREQAAWKSLDDTVKKYRDEAVKPIYELMVRGQHLGKDQYITSDEYQMRLEKTTELQKKFREEFQKGAEERVKAAAKFGYGGQVQGSQAEDALFTMDASQVSNNATMQYYWMMRTRGQRARALRPGEFGGMRGGTASESLNGITEDQKAANDRELAHLDRVMRLNEAIVKLRTGPGGEMDEIEKSYGLRIAYAQKEYEIVAKTQGEAAAGYKYQEKVEEAQVNRIEQIDN
jgi:hypothetical protein